MYACARQPRISELYEYDECWKNWDLIFITIAGHVWQESTTGTSKSRSYQVERVPHHRRAYRRTNPGFSRVVNNVVQVRNDCAEKMRYSVMSALIRIFHQRWRWIILIKFTTLITVPRARSQRLQAIARAQCGNSSRTKAPWCFEMGRNATKTFSGDLHDRRLWGGVESRECHIAMFMNHILARLRQRKEIILVVLFWSLIILFDDSWNNFLTINNVTLLRPLRPFHPDSLRPCSGFSQRENSAW